MGVRENRRRFGAPWRAAQGQRGRGVQSHLPPRLPQPPQPEPSAAASNTQSFPPETRPGTSRLLPGFLAPSGAKAAGSAFERAPGLPPAAGSFGDALVRTVWGGLDHGHLSPSLLLFPLGWGRGQETVVIVFVVVLLGRDGRRLFSWEWIEKLRPMEACILLDPEGKIGVRAQPQSWLAGKCSRCKRTFAGAGQPWVALGWARS